MFFLNIEKFFLVIDSVNDYVEYMKEIFDFKKVFVHINRDFFIYF